MENSLLLEMLQLLRRPEILALRKFLQSPYHNSRVDVILLFEYISAKNSVNLETLSDRKSIFQNLTATYFRPYLAVNALAAYYTPRCLSVRKTFTS
jgi:hypothetical protein